MQRGTHCQFLQSFFLFLPLLLLQLLTLGVKKYILFFVLHSTDRRPAQFARSMLRAQMVQFSQRRNHHATVVSLDSLEQHFVEKMLYEIEGNLCGLVIYRWSNDLHS